MPVSEVNVANGYTEGFPGGSVVKKSPANAGDRDWIPGSGRSPGEGNDNPLRYSCLGNPMDRGAWWATVHGSQRVGHDLETRQHQWVHRPLLNVVPRFL